ncbi:MAG: ATP-binding protein [Ignavibacteriales bacterium]|nr:ATP-binding protein [Ignavibacteriales bacterium]
MSIAGPQIEALRSSIAFRGLSENDLQSIASRMKEESHPAGMVLIDIDEKVDRVFLIIRGKVRISRFTSFGEETTLNMLGDGNIVGEFGVVDDRGSSARVTCAEQSLFYTLTRKDLDELLTSNPRVSRNIMREFTVRVRQANDNVVHQLEVERSNTSTQLRKLSQLIEASRSVNSTLDLEKLLGLILDAAVKSTDADRGTVYLVDSVKNELWSKVLGGTNMIEIRLPMGKGIAGYVAQTGETINIPDAYTDPRFNPEVDKRSGYRTRNVLCMPLKNKDGKIIGVFQLFNRKDGSFTADDEQFVEGFSTHASIAIENARLAQEMVANERLSAVGRMASTIIHDIKNPMGTLRVYAQVMKRKSGNEEAAKLADDMIHQVDRFVNMTQEILDFSRGVSAANIQELEFEQVMSSVLDFIEKDLSKNNVQLVRSTRFEGKVKMDQDKMIRVFYNLASNARDAMPQGGSLVVLTERSNGNVKIEFTDSGSGMPEEVRARIFEPFMTYGKKHGTGLGMAIVKKVIDDHHGKIEIDSEMGKGTTIRILLPL